MAAVAAAAEETQPTSQQWVNIVIPNMYPGVHKG